jgi:hypothetical protein
LTCGYQLNLVEAERLARSSGECQVRAVNWIKTSAE